MQQKVIRWQGHGCWHPRLRILLLSQQYLQQWAHFFLHRPCMCCHEHYKGSLLWKRVCCLLLLSKYSSCLATLRGIHSYALRTLNQGTPALRSSSVSQQSQHSGSPVLPLPRKSSTIRSFLGSWLQLLYLRNSLVHSILRGTVESSICGIMGFPECSVALKPSHCFFSADVMVEKKLSPRTAASLHGSWLRQPSLRFLWIDGTSYVPHSLRIEGYGSPWSFCRDWR